MKLSEFQIDLEFYMSDRRWRVTDVGSRVVCAIRVDQVGVASMRDGLQTTRTLSKREAEAQHWFSGPPYGVVESVIDEDEQDACTLAYAYILGLDDE